MVFLLAITCLVVSPSSFANDSKDCSFLWAAAYFSRKSLVFICFAILLFLVWISRTRIYSNSCVFLVNNRKVFTMEFRDIHKEVNRQIGARTYLNQYKEDIFQESALLIIDKKLTTEKAVQKAINKYKYQARPQKRPKHVDISTIDIAEQEIKPSLVHRHPLTERQKRRLFEKFDSVEKVKVVLEDYGYRFYILHSTNDKYESAIQMVEPCPICESKGCFTIYENNSYLTYYCHTSEDKEIYKKYPNNVTSIISLITGIPREEVKERIYKNL
jgi:hypothetical protein